MISANPQVPSSLQRQGSSLSIKSEIEESWIPAYAAACFTFDIEV